VRRPVDRVGRSAIAWLTAPSVRAVEILRGAPGPRQRILLASDPRSRKALLGDLAHTRGASTAFPAASSANAATCASASAGSRRSASRSQ
jgi:hypothetical protein